MHLTPSRPSLTTRSVVIRKKDPLAADLGGEIALFSAAQGKYFALDTVAAAIWDRLAEATAVSSICESLRGEFDVEHDRCERDVLAFLDRLIVEDLIDVRYTSHGEE
jgi:hypothetical protein